MKRICEMQVEFVDCGSELRAMMDDLTAQSTATDWHLNVDFEGVQLSRHGEICVGQFSGKGSHTVYVVDFEAMNPFEEDNRLQVLLESQDVLKLLFDPRNDADALGSLYGVRLANVLCLQLAENALRRTRGRPSSYVHGFDVVTRDTLPTVIENFDVQTMQRIKQAGRAIYRPEDGGSFEAFKQRPLDATLLQYCALDVYYFDELKVALYDGLHGRWKTEVCRCSTDRARAWLNPLYEPTGGDKTKSPLKRRKH